MNREQMIEKTTRAYILAGGLCGVADQMRFVLDAILPQVTTVEEWAALPHDALLLSECGATRRAAGGYVAQSDRDWLRDFGPLTVVWQP